MKNIVSIFLFSQMLFSLMGCNFYKPYKIERSEFLSKVKIIGIMPVEMDDNTAEFNLPVKEETKIEIEKELEVKLKETGFAVVPGSDFRAIQNSIKIAGTESKKTKLLGRYEYIDEPTRNEYLAKYKVDAMVWPRFIVSRASWSGSNAYWLGVTESITAKKGFWEFLGTSNCYGYAPALSLKITVKNIEEATYYANYGGIQLLKNLNVGFGPGFIDVPKEKILSDPEKIAKAIEIACAPLRYEEIPMIYKHNNEQIPQ